VKGDYPSFSLEKDKMESPNHFASGVSIALFFNEVRKMVKNFSQPDPLYL